jgi:hypothetical protein
LFCQKKSPCFFSTSHAYTQNDWNVM